MKQSKNTTPPSDPLITRNDARMFLGGIGLSTLRELEKSGVLPPPIKLTQRVQGWRRSTLDRVLDGLSA